AFRPEPASRPRRQGRPRGARGAARRQAELRRARQPGQHEPRATLPRRGGVLRGPQRARGGPGRGRAGGAEPREERALPVLDLRPGQPCPPHAPGLAWTDARPSVLIFGDAACRARIATEGAFVDVKLSMPFSELLGVELVEVTPERVVARLKVRPELCTRPAV